MHTREKTTQNARESFSSSQGIVKLPVLSNRTEHSVLPLGAILFPCLRLDALPLFQGRFRRGRPLDVTGLESGCHLAPKTSEKQLCVGI